MRSSAALIPLLALALAAASPQPGGARAQETPDLPLGSVVEREIAGGQRHQFRVAVGAAGTFLRVTILPALDVGGLVAVLLRPDGTTAREVVADSGFDAALVSYVAETAGDYRLTVHPRDPDAGRTGYHVQLCEFARATARDADRVRAEQLVTEAAALTDDNAEATVRRAIDLLHRARALFRETADAEGEVRALDLMGWTHCFGLGELQAATVAMRAKIQVLRGLGETLRVAHTLEMMRWFAQSLNDYQANLDLSQEALEAYQAAGDRDGVVNGLMGVGNAFRTLGLWERAAEAFDRADAADRSADSNHPNTWLAGQFYEQAGLFPKAAERYEQAAARARGLNDPAQEVLNLNRAAGMYARMGMSGKALEEIGRVLAFWQSRGKEPDASTLTRLGRTYGWLGDRVRGIEYLDRALAATPGGGPGAPLRDVAAIAIGYHDAGEYERAIRCYEEVLAFVRADNSRNREARVLARIAAAERDLGRYDAAIARIREALALYETFASGIASPDVRTDYFTFIQDFYDLYIELLMRKHAADPHGGYDAQALQVSERARARTLMDILAEAHVDIRRGVDPALLEKERSLGRRLDRLAARQRLLSPEERSGPAGQALAKEIAGQLAELMLTEGRIRAASPRYVALAKAAPLEAGDIQQRVLDADTLLLEFALGQARSYLWVVSRSGIASFTLPPRDDVEKAARRVYDLIVARNQRRPGESAAAREARLATARADYPPAARVLADMLLAPAVGLLGRKRWVIVAQGGLQYIPFAALPDPSAAGREAGRPPIVEAHEVTYLPSASALAVLRGEIARRPPAPRPLAIVADPVFDKDDARVARAMAEGGAAGYGPGRPADARPGAPNVAPSSADLVRAVDDAGISSGGRIPRVAFSRREAAAIGGNLPAGPPFEAFDFQAAKRTATSPELSRYRIVHFATHALLHDAQANLSGLVLSLVDERGAPQDGFLRLRDIYNLDLPADLVVLSACQTALGKDARGEGLVSLARGFMYAGAARVAASLWKVDDAATADLMARFYRHVLRERRPPAEALRAAQLEMRREARWQDPYYWAAFQLQGEWR